MSPTEPPHNPYFSQLLEKHFLELFNLAKKVSTKFKGIHAGDLASEAALSLLRSRTPAADLTDALTRKKYFAAVLRNRAINMVQSRDARRRPNFRDDENSLSKYDSALAVQKIDPIEFLERLAKLSLHDQRVIAQLLRHGNAAAVGRELFPAKKPGAQKVAGNRAVEKAGRVFFGLPPNKTHAAKKKPLKRKP